MDSQIVKELKQWLSAARTGIPEDSDKEQARDSHQFLRAVALYPYCAQPLALIYIGNSWLERLQI